jgi:hypothetical protein
MRKLQFGISALCTILLTFIYSGSSLASETFKKNTISVQAVTGAVFSPFLIGRERPSLNYSKLNLRLGWMLGNPGESALFPGNFEPLLEITGSDIFTGYGNYMAGGTALLRYNFVEKGRRLIPYVQAGGGILYTDADEDRNQTVIGNSIEFSLQGGAGLRWMIKKSLSMDFEGIFEHISNAGLSDRNAGSNGAGGFVGFTYYFDAPR